MNNQGFTLWECLCVLLVISVLGILPLMKLERWKEQQLVTSQLIGFERLYEKSQHSAVIELENSKVSANKLTQQLVFNYTFKGDKIEEVIDIKPPLIIDKKSEVTLRGGSASPSKLETFQFIDESRDTVIRYVVQLGSSKVFRYEEKQ